MNSDVLGSSSPMRSEIFLTTFVCTPGLHCDSDFDKHEIMKKVHNGAPTWETDKWLIQWSRMLVVSVYIYMYIYDVTSRFQSHSLAELNSHA